MRCLGLVALLFVLLALPGCADSEELKPDDSEGEMNWEEFKRETRKSIEYMQPEYRKRMEDLGLDPINMKRPEQLSEENKKLRLRKRREAAIQPKNQPTSQPKNQEKKDQARSADAVPANENIDSPNRVEGSGEPTKREKTID